MKRTVWLWQIFGFAAVSLGGTLLHFLYEWLGGAVWIAPFSGVNESTWEHMKLLFWPLLIYAVIESFFFRCYNSFWCIKLKGTLLGLGLIPTVFYLYNGVIGKSPDFVNIAIFFISAAAVFIYETYLSGKRSPHCKRWLAIATLSLIGLAFILFTFTPPHLNIFKDPITYSYGISLCA